MKKSIAYLPLKNQEDLNFIVETILERIKQTEMIILFGSYARDEYVVYDERYEFGKLQFYVSDYDILVVTNDILEGVAGRILDNIENIYYRRAEDPDRQPALQFINSDIKKLNRALDEGRYFYTQIQEEGVVLYDSERFKLAPKRKLNFEEIRLQAQEYFENKMKEANYFYDDAVINYEKERYQRASFYLHQACENYFYTVRLVYTLQNSKMHNLKKLLNSIKKYSSDFIKVFPCNTPEEKKLFDLIKAAYVNGRYDPDFEVTKGDIKALIPRVELLHDITKRICEERIKEYERRV